MASDYEKLITSICQQLARDKLRDRNVPERTFLRAEIRFRVIGGARFKLTFLSRIRCRDVAQDAKREQIRAEDKQIPPEVSSKRIYEEWK